MEKFPTTDDDIYVTAAYNIQIYKVFSLEKSDIDNPETTPSLLRIFYMADSLLAASPNLSKKNYEELYENGFKQFNILIYL